MINRHGTRGVTLIELLASLAALSMLVLYFAAFEQIARQDLFGTERRARVQNEASIILETMARELVRVVGSADMTIGGNNSNPIYVRTQGNTTRLKFKWDSNNNGVYDAADQTGCFKMREAGQYTVVYDPTSAGAYAGGACLAGGTTISDRLRAVTINLPDNNDSPFDLTQNSVTVSVTTCWDPAETLFTCGHQENPQVQMTTTIGMPMVSIN